MALKSTFIALIKIILIVVFLPIVLIWYIWKKTDWKRRNKWFATAGSVVVFLFMLIMGAADDTDKIANDSQMRESQEQTKTELQENIDLPQMAESNTDTKEVEAVPENNEIQGEKIKVERVVDGDTIKLENGKVVRYIGIDTPEVVDPRKPVQCFGKDASAKNRELVEGKEVMLVKDVSETDKYDRLLRYVYIGDTFVNDYLVRNGYAYSYSYPPDVKYQDQFKQAEQEARNNKRGLWKDDACKIETTAVPIPTIPTPSSSSNSGSTGSYTCNCSKTCAQMGCAEAQYQLNACGCSKRDADKDGIACDANCQ
jgi:micrococcal nuclease